MIVNYYSRTKYFTLCKNGVFYIITTHVWSQFQLNFASEMGDHTTALLFSVDLDFNIVIIFGVNRS